MCLYIVFLSSGLGEFETGLLNTPACSQLAACSGRCGGRGGEGEVQESWDL